MKKITAIIIIFLASFSAIEAKKIDRLEKRLDNLEYHLRELYHEMQFLRECVQDLEQKVDPQDHSDHSYEDSKSSDDVIFKPGGK